MSNKPHKISQEVKKDIVRRVKEEGVPVAQAAKEHGVHESSIYNWLGANIQGAPSWGELAKLQRENKELLAMIGELTVRLSYAQKKN